MKPFDDLSETDLLSLVIYGEARNQGRGGMLAVASVVMNRVKKQSWYGKTIHQVILMPLQFSCFNVGNPNRAILEKFGWWLERGKPVAELFESRSVAEAVINGFSSNVDGATHYHTTIVHPHWDAKMKFICQIKDHLFYEEVL